MASNPITYCPAPKVGEVGVRIVGRFKWPLTVGLGLPNTPLNVNVDPNIYSEAAITVDLVLRRGCFPSFN